MYVICLTHLVDHLDMRRLLAHLAVALLLVAIAYLLGEWARVTLGA